jgi:hypothetical protein
MNHKQLVETAEVDTSGWYADWELLYAFKYGKKRTFFCGQIYFPLSVRDTEYNLMENLTVEFGVGIRIL